MLKFDPSRSSNNGPSRKPSEGMNLSSTIHGSKYHTPKRNQSSRRLPLTGFYPVYWLLTDFCHIGQGGVEVLTHLSMRSQARISWKQKLTFKDIQDGLGALLL